MDLEWDAGKARTNERKHGVTFDEATSVLGDPLAVSFEDPGHPYDERRFVVIGMSKRRRLLAVVTVETGGERTRLISAREATPKERHDYQETQI